MMTKARRRRQVTVRMEDAAQALIEQAYVLCSQDNHTTWQRRQNSTELLRRGRAYAHAVAAVRRS